MDDVPCPHRQDAIGTVQCGCGGERRVYRCDHPVAGGLVTRHVAQPKRRFVRLFVRMPDGQRKLELPSFKIPACVHCPHRPGASPELIAMFGQPESPCPEVPAPEPPTAREPLVQQAIEAICSSCPRLDAQGQRFDCQGVQLLACPLALWPVVLPDQPGLHRRGCCD